MGIEADKEEIGSIVWVDICKFAQDGANEGDHNTSDIGVLWAEDKIATLTAEHTALVEAARAYMLAAGHTAKCWTKWNTQPLDQMTETRKCICGHDALANLIDTKGGRG